MRYGTYVRIYVHCILHNYLKFRRHLELYTIQCAYITHTHTHTHRAANSRQIPDRERKNERVRIFQNSDLIEKGMILQENKIKL